MPWVAAHEWMSSRCWITTTVTGQWYHTGQLTSEPTYCTPHPSNDEGRERSTLNDDTPELPDLVLVDEDEDIVVNATVTLNSDCHGLCDLHGSRVGYSPGRVRVAFM